MVSTHFLHFSVFLARDTLRPVCGGASDLVIGAVFKTVGRMREHASVGFDSHTPPPLLANHSPGKPYNAVTQDFGWLSRRFVHFVANIVGSNGVTRR